MIVVDRRIIFNVGAAYIYVWNEEIRIRFTNVDIFIYNFNNESPFSR